MFEIILYHEILSYFLICFFTFFISFYYPSIGGGITLGLHGVLAGLSSIFGIKIIVFQLISALLGQLLNIIKRKDFLALIRPIKDFRVILSIVFISIYFFVGIVGWVVNGNNFQIFIDTFFNNNFSISKLIERNDIFSALTIITRFLPYFFLVYFACYEFKFKNFLLAFSIIISLNIFLIPIGYLEAYLNNNCYWSMVEGFRFPGWNRAVIGYETAISIFVIYTYLNSFDNKLKNYFLILLLFISMLVHINCFTKGPYLSLIFVLITLTITNFNKEKFLIFLGTFFLAVLITFIFYYNCFSEYGIQNYSLNNTYMFKQSFDIRVDLIKNYEQNSNFNHFFGSGFGGSRLGMDVSNFIYNGTGSHIFFFDVFLDTGIIGLFSIIAIIFLLNTGSILKNLLKESTNLNQCLFCFGSIVFFKLIIASDSYSEPLLVTFLVLLILSFKKRIEGVI